LAILILWLVKGSPGRSGAGRERHLRGQKDGQEDEEAGIQKTPIAEAMGKLYQRTEEDEEACWGKDETKFRLPEPEHH
jgi:hypothetical protein